MTSPTRRFLAAGLIGALLIALLGLPSIADDLDDLERQKTYLGKKITDAKQSYDQASKELAIASQKLRISQGVLAEAQAQLGGIRGELAAARARDAQIAAELRQAELDLRTAEAELKRGAADLEKSEQVVREFTVQLLQEGDPGMRAFGGLLSGENPAEFTDKMAASTAVADAQLARMQELEAVKVMLGVKRDQVEKLRDQIKIKKAEAAANVKRMEGLEAKAAIQAAKVGELVEVNRQNRNAADAIADREAAKVRALEADRSRTERMIRDLIARQKNSGDNSGGDGGQLSYPLSSARITSPYGMRVHPVTGVYKLHDGTDFGAGCGTPIRAAGAGTIISQYYNAGYGNRVIVAHGTINGVNIVTTYNHLSRYALSSGSRVSRGQTIGYVGSTGYSTGCHLHFMVLANGSTTNPMNWL